MSATDRVESLLREHGATIARVNKHIVYKFPDGRIFSVSQTPSDWRAGLNRLKELKRMLGLTATEARVGERREKRCPTKPSEPRRNRGPQSFREAIAPIKRDFEREGLLAEIEYLTEALQRMDGTRLVRIARRLGWMGGAV